MCVTEVGCLWGGTRLVTHDPRTSIYTSNSAKNIGHGLESSRTAGGCNQGAAVEADATGELQLKRTQLGSMLQPKRTQSGSSWSGRKWRAAAEVDVIGEQQLKQTQTGSCSWSGSMQWVVSVLVVAIKEALWRLQLEWLWFLGQAIWILLMM